MALYRRSRRRRPRRRRAPPRYPLRIGLTGSLGMGKSTAAAMLRWLGAPVFDADAVVRQALGPGGAALPAIAAAFGDGVIGASGVDRSALGEIVFHDAGARRRLEAIVHPLVGASERAFARRCALRRQRLAAFDIPLLFETGAQARMHCTVLVLAPAALRDKRALRRPGMTRRRLEAIVAAQMSDRRKRRLADYVVPTGLGRGLTLRRLRQVIHKCGSRGRQGGRHA